jgi:cephalosporin-C deacetylase-like acetyl esterase
MNVIERSELNYFVMEWLTRTPTVNLVIQLKPYESDFLTKEEMLVAYIEGCALYGMKHKGNGNQKSQDLAGLKVVAFMAENSKTYYKESKFKDLIRAVNKDHLDELYDDYNKTKQP